MNGYKFIDVIKYSLQEELNDFFKRTFSLKVFVDVNDDLEGFIYFYKKRKGAPISNIIVSFQFYNNNLPINSFEDDVDCVNLIVERFKNISLISGSVHNLRDLVHDIKWFDDLNIFGPVGLSIYELSNFFIHDFLYLLNMRRDYKNYLSIIERANNLLGEVVF